MILASHKLRMAMAGITGPAENTIYQKSKTITVLPPSMIRVNTAPSCTTLSSAFINRKISGAKMAPVILSNTAAATASKNRLCAGMAAASGFFSPIRRATHCRGAGAQAYGLVCK